MDYFKLDEVQQKVFDIAFGKRRHEDYHYFNDKCYFIESKVFRPVVYKSEFFNKYSKIFLQCKTKNKLTIEVKKMYSILVNKFGLQDIKLKKNKSSGYSTKSYYSSAKSSVFINEKHFENVLQENNKDKVDDTKRLIYVIFHELAHAFDDIHLQETGGGCHDYLFFEALFFMFKGMLNIDKQKFLRQRFMLKEPCDILDAGKEIPTYNFDQYMDLHPFYHRMRSDNFRIIGKFNSIDEVEVRINKSVGYNFVNKEKMNSRLDRDIIYFSKDNLQVFADKIFIYTKINNEYLLFEYKELKFKKVMWDNVLNHIKLREKIYIKNGTIKI